MINPAEVIDSTTKLLLGSSSPRRREILETLRIPFFAAAAAVDESPRAEEDPAAYLSRIVEAKLARASTLEAARGAGALLVADTSVIVDDAILGKPEDVEEARRMLSVLSGRAHEVWTRFAVGLQGSEGPAAAETVKTRVVFRRLEEGEIERYAASGEGLDKAGGYAIQGLGAFAAIRIEGSYSNVVGLPACEVVSALLRCGLLQHFPLEG